MRRVEHNITIKQRPSVFLLVITCQIAFGLRLCVHLPLHLTLSQQRPSPRRMTPLFMLATSLTEAVAVKVAVSAALPAPNTISTQPQPRSRVCWPGPPSTLQQPSLSAPRPALIVRLPRCFRSRLLLLFFCFFLAPRFCLWVICERRAQKRGSGTVQGPLE